MIASKVVWQDFLEKFDFTLKYKPGKVNVVADVLSRNAVLAPILSSTSSNIGETIREGMEHDVIAKKLLVLAKQGRMRKFWEENGLL